MIVWLRRHWALLLFLLLLVLAPLAFFLIPPWEAPSTGSVFTIAEVKGNLWIGGSGGAYMVGEGKAIPVLQEPWVNTIAELSGNIWIGGNKGGYRLEEDKKVAVLQGQEVNTITEAKGSIWIGSEKGAYRLEGDKAIPILENQWVNTIVEVKGEVWVGGASGIHRIEGNKAIPILENQWVNTIAEVDGKIWTGGKRGLYRVEEGEAIPISESQWVNTIAEVNGAIWIGDDEGLYRLKGGKQIAVLKGQQVYTLSEIRGQIWIGTDKDAYRVKGNDVIPILDRPWARVIRDVIRYLPSLILGLFIIVQAILKVSEQRRPPLVRAPYALTDESIPSEIEEARQRMERLFPQGGTFKRAGIHLAHRRTQATTISGDFYNFIPRADGSLGIYLADVQGHGLAASNQARSLYQAVTDGKWGMGDAREELESADELLSKGAIFQQEEVALCMNFTEIHPENMEIRHANAGMPFPLLFRWNEAEPEVLRAAGIYVGAGYSHYPVKPDKAEVKVSDGDILVIASDGILEARDDRGRIFGQKGITAAVFRSRDNPPEDIADEIMDAVKRHTGQKRPQDDQILVVVQIGEPIKETRLLRRTTLEERDGIFTLMNARDTGTVCHNELRPKLKTWAQNMGFEERRINQIWFATWEAVYNAIEHGSKPGDTIHIRLILPKSTSLLEVEVKQPLIWKNWDRYLGRERIETQTDPVSMDEGIGTSTMLWLADEIHVTELGRQITMRFSPDVVPARSVAPKRTRTEDDK